MSTERSAIERELSPRRNRAPISESTKTLIEVSDTIAAELDVTADAVAAIGNRQRILTEQLAHLSERAIPAIREIAEAGSSYALLADEADTPEQRTARLAEAEGRIHAALTLAQIQRIQVAYLAVANAADDAGYPSSRTVEILGSVDRALEPLVEAALTFDPQRIRDGVTRHQDVLRDLNDSLIRWQKALESGTELSQKGIAMADSALIVLSIYQAGRTIAGMSARPGIAGVNANGAAIARATIATDELAEAVRKLIELGALDAGMVSKSPGFAGPLAAPEPILRPTPSGTIVPARGPFAGKEVSYGDPRDKHTKVANNTLEEMRKALANPRKAKGRLKAFADGVAHKEKEYGSQLSKEATDRYEKLVREAVENGRYEDGQFHHSSDDFIGIDVKTGRPTKHYEVHMSASGHGAHVVPVSPRGRR